jgi:hypothetical protein
MIGLRGWSAQEVGGSTLPVKSAAEATWFAVRPMAAANSVNERLCIMVPPDPPVAGSGTLIPSVSLVFLEPSKVRK